MGINVTTSKQQITASVADDKVTANVTAGIGATGPSGVINVTAPITNSGTTTAATIGLAVGSGLSLSSGNLVVTPGTYATLVNGTVPAEQLPSYVDDVLEYASLAAFPATGESGKIYVAINTGKCYRWSGSAYFEISTQPGNTDAVPEGSSNLYFTNARARNAFGTGTTGQVLTWSGGQWTAGSAYTLPVATASVLGGVKIGSGISIDGNGVISASSGYTLPTATNSVLGGVKIGSGVTITDGVISVSTNYAAATHTHATSDITGLDAALSGINSAISGKVDSTDSRLSDAREWSADTISQAEAEAGTATTRRAFTAQRVFQAIAAWWNASSAKTKLDGIASGATANATDAQLRDRSTHTGTQAASTITGLASVATLGTYSSLSGLPTLGTAAAQDSTAFAAASHTHALSSLTQSGATTGQVVTWNGSAWAAATPTTYTLPSATTSTLGGIIVGAGLSVSSGTVSANVTSVAGRTGAVTISASDVSGLGTLATQNGTFSGTSSGTNTGDQTITLTGDVTGSGTGTFAATIANGSVTDAKITSSGLSASSINWVAIQPWAANTAYSKGALVSYLGVAYRRSAAGTSGTTFNTANWQQVTPSLFTVRSAVVSSTAYTGRAVSGSATSDSVWTIRRAIYTSAGAVSATATATNVKWDDRLTASYS